MSQTALIVEDHPGVRALAVLVLENAGWTVVWAASKSDADAILGAREVDVIVSDIGIPDGGERVPTYPPDARGRRAGLVYMSGGAFELEGAHVLPKPFAPEALVAAAAAATC